MVLVVGAFFLVDGDKYLSLDWLRERRGSLLGMIDQSPLVFGLFFAIVYVIATALSLPGATVLTIASGTLFGFGPGLLIASFSSTIGATLAFLLTRLFFREWAQRRFARYLGRINSGFRRDGGIYLFALRLAPLFPFFVVNIAMGLTPIRAGQFYLISQLAMLPGTALFVYAGTQIANLNSASDILSLRMIASLTAIGLMPLAARFAWAQFRQRSRA